MLEKTHCLGLCAALWDSASSQWSQCYFLCATLMKLWASWIWFWVIENAFLVLVSTFDGKQYGCGPDLLFQGKSDFPFPTGKKKTCPFPINETKCLVLISIFYNFGYWFLFLKSMSGERKSKLLLKQGKMEWTSQYAIHFFPRANAIVFLKMHELWENWVSFFAPKTL